MIIKIKSHKRESFRKILEYMMNEKERLYDKNQNSFIITHNLKGKTINDWVIQYKANEQFRKIKRKDNVKLTHEILSWHIDDAKKLSTEKMKNMVQEYIRHRNPKGLFVAVPHYDKKHFHVHLCVSGVEYKTGKSLRISKIALQNLKKEIQEYQKEKYPELLSSIVIQDKKRKEIVSDKEYQTKFRIQKLTDREQLLELVHDCFKKARSKAEFIKILHASKLKIYQRSNQTSGVIFNGRKFRFNRLGFTTEKLSELEVFERRQNELVAVRRAINNDRGR